MPVSRAWLDDDHNLVPPDEAALAVETETDEQGRLVAHRWIRIVRAGSAEEELVRMEREAQQLAPLAPSPAPRRWLWAALLLLIAIVMLWFLLR